VESHSAFCKKLKLNYPLLADIEKKVSKQFDAINFLGMSKRLLVLIGTDKKVLWTDSTLSIKYIKSEEILEKVGFLSNKEMT
jgi:peroxiredoxin